MMHFDILAIWHLKVCKVSSHVYLGLRFSKDLKWQSHIKDVYTKARKRLNAMLPLKYKLDRYSLQIMYTSFVRSTLDYASVVWGGTYKSDFMLLEKIQVDAMRLITGATARSNRLKLYQEIPFLTIKQRVSNTILTMMFKIKSGLCPTYLSNLIIVNEQPRYNFRSQSAVVTPFARLETFKRSFIPHASTLWNNISFDLQNSGSLEGFKQLLNIANDCCNTLYYYGERWPAIHHARLRTGCSKLNCDLFHNLHVTDSPSCQCGYISEDAYHFFFSCPLFTDQRQHLLDSVMRITLPSLNVLLYGDPALSLEINREVFQAVHKYISTTERFQ